MCNCQNDRFIGQKNFFKSLERCCDCILVLKFTPQNGLQPSNQKLLRFRPTPTHSWLQMAMLSKSLQKASLALNSSTVASSTQASCSSGPEIKSLPTTPLRPLSASAASKPITVTTRSTFVVPSTGFNEGSSRTWSGHNSGRPKMVEVPTILSETGNRGPATPDPSLMMNLMSKYQTTDGAVLTYFLSETDKICDKLG